MNQLLFTPYAYSKMLFLRDKSTDEVSGFGVTPNLPNLIEDIAVPKQKVTSAYVDLDEDGVAHMCEDLAKTGLQPAQFFRIWIHTHPKGIGPSPSERDRKTMNESFSAPDYAVMAIMSQNGENFAELRINKPFPITKELAFAIDYKANFPASNRPAWEEEYNRLVTKQTYSQPTGSGHWTSGAYQSYGSGYGGYQSELTKKLHGICLSRGWADNMAQQVATIGQEMFQRTPCTAPDVEEVVLAATLFTKVGWPGIYNAMIEAGENKFHAMAPYINRILIVLFGGNGYEVQSIVHEAKKQLATTAETLKARKRDKAVPQQEVVAQQGRNDLYGLD